MKINLETLALCDGLWREGLLWEDFHAKLKLTKSTSSLEHRNNLPLYSHVPPATICFYLILLLQLLLVSVLLLVCNSPLLILTRTLLRERLWIETLKAHQAVLVSGLCGCLQFFIYRSFVLEPRWEPSLRCPGSSLGLATCCLNSSTPWDSTTSSWPHTHSCPSTSPPR